MKTSTKLIVVGTLLGTLGLAGVGRFASAGPAQSLYATLSEQRDNKLTAQASDRETNDDTKAQAGNRGGERNGTTKEKAADQQESAKLQALVFGALIAATTAGYYYLQMNTVLAFWIAYILTRPLGASIGDLLSQPTTNGGFGWGTVGTSMVFLSIIASLVIYLSLNQKKTALPSIEPQA